MKARVRSKSRWPDWVMRRPPFSSSNGALDNSSWATIRSVSVDGYVTVLASRDSRDWTTPGTDRIVSDSALSSRIKSARQALHDDGRQHSVQVALPTMTPVPTGEASELLL